MGNDGFVTAKKPDKAIYRINEYGLEAKEVGQLEAGKTGVVLAGIKASDGKDVYFSGR